MTRLDANRQLVYLLSALVEAFPDQRFSQILSNYGFVSGDYVDIIDNGGHNFATNVWYDEFSVEGKDILTRVLACPHLPDNFATALKVLYGESNASQTTEDIEGTSPCDSGCGSCSGHNCGDKKPSK